MKTFLVALLVAFIFQQNQPPVVKITLPKANENLKPGSQVRYSIDVSDKEDGDTKFDEINSNEILLTVNSGKVKPNDKSALHAMMSSNCMNCHAFKSKLIGPSFMDISIKKSNTAELIKHVKDGSSGIWGEIVMPSHPELSNEEIAKMVNWILKFKDEKTVEYYLGKEGSFSVNGASAVTLTASYLDHGKIMGEDKIAIRFTPHDSRFK